jgi:hypothetical protein
VITFIAKSPDVLANVKRGTGGYWRRTWRGMSLIFAIFYKGIGGYWKAMVSPYFLKCPSGVYFHNTSQYFLTKPTATV